MNHSNIKMMQCTCVDMHVRYMNASDALKRSSYTLKWQGLTQFWCALLDYSSHLSGEVPIEVALVTLMSQREATYL